MPTDEIRDELFGWLRSHVNSIPSGDATSLDDIEVPMGTSEATIVDNIKRLASLLPSVIQALAQLSAPEEDSQSAGSKLAEETRGAAEAASWNEVGDLAGFIRGLFTLSGAELPEIDFADSFYSFDWKDDVEGCFELDRETMHASLAQYVVFCESYGTALASAELLQLGAWKDLLARQFEEVAIKTLLLAIRLRQWTVATKMRGRYLAAWRAAMFSDSRGDRGIRAEGAFHLWFEIGQEVARMHSAVPPLVLRSRAGEDELGITDNKAPGHRPSAGSRILDIATLYRGADSETWKGFAAGYAEHDNIAASAIRDIRPEELADERRASEHFGVERPGNIPNFTVHLCTRTLRDRSGVRDQLRNRLQQIEAQEDLERRAFDAAILASESDDIRTREVAVFESAVQPHAPHESVAERRRCLAMLSARLKREIAQDVEHVTQGSLIGEPSWKYIPKLGQARMELWREAADVGNADAQWLLGVCYQHGLGVRKSVKQAARWYRLAADQGNARAMTNLSVLYELGSGVDRDLGQAEALLRDAAERGFAWAQRMLAGAFQNGDFGVRDRRAAIRWYRQAADQGDAPSCVSLGCCYELGHVVKENQALAAQWFRKAAKLGSADGMRRLGLAYLRGEGVKENRQQAQHWLKAAVEMGNERAQREWAELDHERPPSDPIGFVKRIEIIIKLAGDGFPTEHELVLRNELERNLLEDAVGDFVGAGGGGGQMDLAFEVEDFRTAKRRVVSELKKLGLAKRTMIKKVDWPVYG